MSNSETKKRKKWVIVLCIASTMIVEAIIVFWPLACTSSDKGLWAIWSAMDEQSVQIAAARLFLGFVIGLGIGLSSGLRQGLTPGLLLGPTVGLLWGLWVPFSGPLGTCLWGLVWGLIVGAVYGMRSLTGYVNVFCMVVAGLFWALIWVSLGRFVGLLSIAFTGVGIPLGMLLIYGLKQLPKGVASTFRGFFMPWRLRTYSFGKAIAFFAVVYVGIVLLFSLWFNASYLGGTDENPAFKIPGESGASWGDFVYFSFVTITTLGYGDISPLRPLPKVLVVLETLMGVGGVVVYIGMMLQVASRTAERQAHSPEKGQS